MKKLIFHIHFTVSLPQILQSAFKMLILIFAPLSSFSQSPNSYMIMHNNLGINNRTIKEYKNSNYLQEDIGNIAQGIYLLKIFNENKNLIKVHKITIY